jgi:aspartokinase-like uncharacterized kinase
MYEQINAKQFVTLSKQFSDAAFKAHTLAVSGLERAVEVQLKAIETQVNAAVDFFSEAAETRDADSARSLFPKSIALAKDSAEKVYATTQELIGLTVKTTEAIGDLVKANIESANASIVKPAAKKAAK